jgi:hypothetical protein
MQGDCPRTATRDAVPGRGAGGRANRRRCRMAADHEVVHERGDSEANIGMTHKTCDRLFDVLPVNQFCRCAEHEEREPYRQSSPERVDEVMAATLQCVHTHGCVVNRVQPPQDGVGVAYAMVEVLKRVSENNDDDDLRPNRATLGPYTEDIRETDEGDGTRQNYQKEESRSINRQCGVCNCVADVSPDLAIAANRPISAVGKPLLDLEQCKAQHYGRNRHGVIDSKISLEQKTATRIVAGRRIGTSSLRSAW